MEVLIAYALMGLGFFTIIGSFTAAGELAWKASLRYPADDRRSDTAFARCFYAVAVPGMMLGFAMLVAAPTIILK